MKKSLLFVNILITPNTTHLVNAFTLRMKQAPTIPHHLRTYSNELDVEAVQSREESSHSELQVCVDTTPRSRGAIAHNWIE